MIVARVYRYRALYSHQRYNVVAQLEEPQEVVPLEVIEVTDRVSRRVAEDWLGGPAELVSVEEWSASMLTLMTGIQPHCVRAELN